MNPNDHSSTIYNSQDMKQPKYPSADEWVKNIFKILGEDML